MDVSISTLRAELSSWIKQVHQGVEVVVTERGTPVARLVPIRSAPLIERLTKTGVLGSPQSTTRPAGPDLDPVSADGSVSELIRPQRG